MKTKHLFLLVFLQTIFSINAQELALVRDNDLFGYINTSGEYVIKPQFQKASSFSGKYAAGLQGDTW